MEGGGKDKEITGDRSKGWWRVSKIKGRMDDENKWMEGKWRREGKRGGRWRASLRVKLMKREEVN